MATPHALQTYTTADLGGNRIDYDRYVDGPDALPIGEHRDHLAGLTGVRLATDDVIEFFRAQELYVTRTRSHLFEDWMVDLVQDLAYESAKAVGRMLANCHRCRITLAIVPSPDAACTYCGTDF